jgi:hypothetical protein
MKPIDTKIAEYLQSKMQNQNPEGQPPMPIAEQQPKFGIEEYNQAVQESQKRQGGLGLAQFASNIGNALAGRDNNSSDAYFDKLGSNIQDQTVGEFGRQKAMQEKGELSDPNSQKSQNFRRLAESTMPSIAKAYGAHWQNVTAADKDSLLNFGKMKESLDSRKQELAQRAEDRARETAMRKEDRSHEASVKQQAKQDAQLEKRQQGMAEIEDRRQNINAALAQAKAMIADKGTYELMGSHNQDLDRLIDQIATDMAKLQDPNSVARPSEVEAVKKTLVKPGFSNTNSTAIDILNNFEQEVNRRAESAYSVRGLQSPTKPQEKTSKPSWAK